MLLIHKFLYEKEQISNYKKRYEKTLINVSFVVYNWQLSAPSRETTKY